MTLQRCVTGLTLAAALALLPACNRNSGGDERKNYGKYTLVGTRYDQTDRNKAKDNAADMLTQLGGEPNVCLIGLWAYNPPAILEAVKAANKQGQVKIVAFDENELTLQGIKEGHIYATAVQQPFEFGYQSVKLMTELVKNPNAALPKDGVMHVPYLVIKKGNVEEFHQKLNEQKAQGAAKEVPGDAKGIKVAFVSNNDDEFWTIAEAGTRKAAAELGVNVLFRRPKQGSAAAQKEIIDDLLNSGVQAIAISVLEPENQGEYLNQIAEKIPLITQDNDAPKSKRKCYIGTDNYEAGKAVGKLIKEVMPDGGKIGIFVGQPDPINARQRRQGVLDELAGEKDAKGK